MTRPLSARAARASLDRFQAAHNPVKAPTLARVRGVVARAAGLQSRRVRVVWIARPVWTTFPTGAQAWVGRVGIEAEGYQPATMIVTADADSIMVR